MPGGARGAGVAGVGVFIFIFMRKHGGRKKVDWVWMLVGN